MVKQKKTIPTLAGIAAGLDALGDRLEKKIEDKVDELARITASNFVRVEENFSGLKDDVSGLKDDVSILKDGQERIELRLTNVAYRFEFKELEKRTEVIEEKVGIKRK